MNIDEEMAMELAKSLRRSRSLLVMHLCGNLDRRFYSDLILKNICERVHAAPQENHIMVNFWTRV